MSGRFLPYGRQWIDDDDIDAVINVLKSDYLTTGPAVRQFEEAFADFVDAGHAIACANGTAALHAAMIALGVGPGDAAIVPSLTFLATANAPHFCGADVVFADVDPKTALMTPESFKAALARADDAGLNPKVVLPVHYAGQLCDMTAIAEIARARGMFIVEDACHALGSQDEDSARAGACAHSDLTCFSFHPVKTIACGEGGMVTTNQSDLAKAVRLAICHGMEREQTDLMSPELSCDDSGARLPWAYEMQAPGYNYRLSDIHAGLALSQLGKLETFISRRRELAAAYDAKLNGLSPHLSAMHLVRDDSALHLYVVRIDFDQLGKPRQQIMIELAARGVGTQVHYIPVHRQPYYRGLSPDLDLPGADAFYAQCLSLPLFPAMTDQDVERVISALEDVLGD